MINSLAQIKRKWNHPLFRWAMTTLLCAGLYVVYSQTVVPWVQPKTSIQRRRPVDLSRYENLPLDDKTEFAGLFPNDAWEWQPCKTLETDQGKILFKDYQQNADGTWDVTPFTMVLKSDDGPSPNADSIPDSANTSPIVLRASDRARLRFNRPLKLGASGGEPTRLEQAQLLGQVTVSRSDDEQPLWIATSNVQVDPQSIRTLDRVEFQLGPHRGAGRNMLIELDHDNSAAQLRRDFDHIRGFRRIQIAFLDHMTLVPSTTTTFQNGNRNGPTGQPNLAASPVDKLLRSTRAPLQIRCAGPFEFDYKRLRASFRDQVSARELRDDGDWLKCEQLDIHFQFANENAAGPTDVAHAETFEELKISQVIATGTPAALAAPSRAIRIVGDYLHYDLNTDTLDAKSESSVQVYHHSSRFGAPQITYTLGPDGRLGKLDAVGAGQMVRSGDNGKNAFATRWQNFMTIRPAGDDLHLVTLDGQSLVELDADTRIQSQSLKLWIRESTELQRGANPTDSANQSRNFHPRRMLAHNDVQIISPRMQGTTQQLVVNWPEPTTTVSRNGRGPTSRGFAADATYTTLPIRTPSALGNEIHTTTPLGPIRGRSQTARRVSYAPTNTGPRDAAASMPLEFRSNNVTIHLNPEGQASRFREVELTGEVDVWQREPVADRARKNSSIDKQLKGDRLVVVPVGPDLYRFDVWGTQGQRPVSIVAGGMSMTGDHATLDQSANRLWLEGAGRMVYRADQANPKPKDGRSAEAGNSKSGAKHDLDIAWTGGMIFDGQRIYFEDAVQAVVTEAASRAPTDLRTTTRTSSLALTITLDRPVSLSNPRGSEISGRSNGAGGVSVRELLLVSQIPQDQRAFSVPIIQASHESGSVTLVNETIDQAGQVRERRELSADSAVILADSQQLTAHGPGELTIYRRRQLNDSESSSGLPMKTALGGERKRNGLDYIQLLFDGRLVASGDSQNMNARGNVRVLYGEVQTTEQRPSADSPRHIPGTVRLTCDTVELAQWTPQSSGQKTSELIATGNAHIVADRFEATAHRVSYDQSTDYVTIEGTTREDAHLWTRPQPGKPANHLVAAKIRYRPSDDATHIDRVRSATFHGR